MFRKNDKATREKQPTNKGYIVQKRVL